MQKFKRITRHADIGDDGSGFVTYVICLGRWQIHLFRRRELQARNYPHWADPPETYTVRTWRVQLEHIKKPR